MTTEAFLQSARAALRKQNLPTEAPINVLTAPPSARPRRKSIGQPAVNVPTEQMAEFLEEVRSAKLKKVGFTIMRPLVGEDTGSSTASSIGYPGYPTRGRDILREIVRRKSLPQLDSRAGDKRKRDDGGDTDDELSQSGEHVCEKRANICT